MKIEIRNDSVLLDGYVNAVERRSKMLSSPRGKFQEVVAEHTFEKALQKNDNVKVLLNHDEKRELASQKQHNVNLFEDNIGLRAQITVTDPDVIKKAQNNELRGFSFGFNKIDDSWEDTGKGYELRTLKDIDLREVSILDASKIPAYNATSIEVRDNSEFILEYRDFIDGITAITEPLDDANIDVVTNTDNPVQESTTVTERTTTTSTTETTEINPNEVKTDYSFYENTITVLKLRQPQPNMQIS